MNRKLVASTLLAALLGAAGGPWSAPAAAQDMRRSEAYGRMDHVMERHARDQFERGYRAGREEEQRRAAQYSGGDNRASRSSSGPDRDPDRYIVIPDVFPETPRYRGIQDFVLMPDRSISMDWLLTAAQSLREAVQAMAEQPPGEARNRAMDRAREALLETQQAMVQLPAELRTR